MKKIFVLPILFWLKLYKASGLTPIMQKRRSIFWYFRYIRLREQTHIFQLLKFTDFAENRD